MAKQAHLDRLDQQAPHKAQLDLRGQREYRERKANQEVAALLDPQDLRVPLVMS